jgi:hypothetical protein
MEFSTFVWFGFRSIKEETHGKQKINPEIEDLGILF